MRCSIRTLIVVVLLLCAFWTGSGNAATKAPPDIVSALIIKLVAFEKNVSSDGNEISIWVIGSPELATELKKGIDHKIGKGTIISVEGGEGLPAQKPSIICISNSAQLAAVTDYSRSQKVLTVTDIPELTSQGVTLGIVTGSDGKPEVTINLTASKAEGLDWNPAIMKIAKTIK
jgi:hypothetical protein